MSERLVLVSEELFKSLVDTQALASDLDYTIEWGEPVTEVLTYYVPVIATAPKQPAIEVADDG